MAAITGHARGGTGPRGGMGARMSATRRDRTARLRRRGAWTAVVLAAVLAGCGSDGGSPDPVVLPTPTPTVEPADRDRTTAFQQALPDAVLAFAVAAQQDAAELRAVGAVEAYTLTYTDGQVEVTVRTGQWRTPAEAGAVLAGILGEPLPGDDEEPAVVRDETVVVGDAEAGRVVVRAGAEVARAVWTNGATLFQVDGPAVVVPAFYDAYPM